MLTDEGNNNYALIIIKNNGKNMEKISIVLPVYNEEGNIQVLYEKIIAELMKLPYNYEIIFVLDGCTDRSEEIITDLMTSDQNIRLVSFTRNFGHQAALISGFNHATGELVITMDSDLQHPPEIIGEMVAKRKEGFNVVNALRKDQGQSHFFKKITSKYFYRLFSRISEIPLDEGSADFRLLDKKVVESLNNLHENEVFLRGMIPWFGYSQTSISYTPQERFSGSTKYSLSRMVKFAISGVSSFSVVPLRLVTYAGFFISALTFLYIIALLYAALVLKSVVSGYTSIIVSVLFLGGIQLIAIGILGEYIGKILIEAKQRPRYVVKNRKGW
jgi:dolichol-phosphate mannosyltransferase